MDYDGYQAIAVERRERVLRLTLNRPEALNAIDAQLHDELSRIFFDVGIDEETDVVVLTGAGRAFCAGGDMTWLQSLIDDPFGWQRVAIEGKRIVLSILEARQPVIAQIQGPAVGLGATIALACDVTFAAEGARIGDPHVSVGLVAGDGATALWPALIGYARARELLYSGELIEADRAAAMGLVNHVVPADRLEAEVDAYAQRLAAGATRAIQWTKVAINQPLRQIASGNLDLSLALEGLSNLTADHAEGIGAFAERRDARFSGR